MAKARVRFTRPHTVIQPATVLESVVHGMKVHIADIPESRTEYAAGQEVVFRSKKDALAFVKCMQGAAELV